MPIFNFKLFELYEHINSYSITANTLEEAVTKAISGEVATEHVDWCDGYIGARGGEDKTKTPIEHPEFITCNFGTPPLVEKSPEQVTPTSESADFEEWFKDWCEDHRDEGLLDDPKEYHHLLEEAFLAGRSPGE